MIRGIVCRYEFLNLSNALQRRCFRERKKKYSSGTGSHPPAENGLHLQILQNAKKPPLTAPKRLTAVSAYCEQLGVKRQERGSLSDKVILYNFISPIRIYFIFFNRIPCRIFTV